MSGGPNPDNAPLNPRVGNMPIFINPGTGAVDNATEEYARVNMAQLMIDCATIARRKVDGLTFKRHKRNDYGDGRFCYRVYRPGFTKPIEVQMPGWTLEGVRYTGAEGQNIWDFPRLYVDDSSWVWKIAANCLSAAWDED